MTRRRAPLWLEAGLVAALLLSGCAPGPSTAIGHPARSTGTVIGGIEPCIGVSLVPVHFVAGTIVALRGSETTEAVSPGEFRSILPHTVVARQTVNDRQRYHFSLAPGPYVLHVIRSRSASELPTIAVKVVAGHTVQAEMPDACK
jgi:hypothetical protein